MDKLQKNMQKQYAVTQKDFTQHFNLGRQDIIMVFPFLWEWSSASFKGINEVFNFPIEWIPKNPTLKGYELLLKGDVPFITSFLNSVKMSTDFTDRHLFCMYDGRICLC